VKEAVVRIQKGRRSNFAIPLSRERKCRRDQEEGVVNTGRQRPLKRKKIQQKRKTDPEGHRK